ncbi:hypothetical protein OCJ37_01830 [Xanthomonas sp. AM6]|uniref:hypothetical protein n=1 Tax=Xanthomonas sp. AM6 TaxID=2982531 RepID=UPI0021D87402|nr:hypothetical protein [Xanthomonas sp. AM6]UYB52731.1 hypothetical protein OCJ37_01830 [Xanthomonas sp. AM6]
MHAFIARLKLACAAIAGNNEPLRWRSHANSRAGHQCDPERAGQRQQADAGRGRQQSVMAKMHQAEQQRFGTGACA